MALWILIIAALIGLILLYAALFYLASRTPRLARILTN